jgi:hypothetical protein
MFEHGAGDGGDGRHVSFAAAQACESRHIDAARAIHKGAQRPDPDDRVGLALSGGGIRSATFCLGVLQALARGRYLQQVDYLSTVSGGGYIGAWLSAFIHRRGVAHALDALARDSREVPEIGHLRRFANYLTPKLGLTSADAWTAVAIYLRNTLLNQAILLPLLVLVLLVPWFIVTLTRCDAGGDGGSPWCGLPVRHPHLVLLLPAFVIVMLVGVWSSVRATRTRTEPGAGGDKEAGLEQAGAPSRTTDWWQREGVAIRSIVGVLFASLLLAHWLQGLHALPEDPFTHGAFGWTFTWPWPVYGALVGVLFAALLLVTSAMLGKEHLLRRFFAARRIRIAFVVAAAISGVALTSGLFAIEWALRDIEHSRLGLWFVQGVGAIAVAGAMFLSIVLFFGLMGRLLPESLREWQASFGAWLLIIGGGWLGLCVLAFVAPPVLASMDAWMRGSGFATWLGSSLLGALLGNRPESGDPRSPGWRDRLLAFVPPLFVLGMLAGLAYALFELLVMLEGNPACKLGRGITGELARQFARHDCLSHEIGLDTLLMLALPCAVLVVALGYRVDVNLFSLHAFYRNRLARCFLGASNRRRPNPVTGFDPHDDVDLAALTHVAPGTDAATAVPQRPLHIVNAALNLTTANDLAWQERMAASFTMTPFHSGFGLPNGPLTERYARTDLHRRESPNGALHLATAMAISGAAASPNMGFHTSSAVAFLMAMFNLRLGWWMPNPGRAEAWRQDTPTYSTAYLLRELLGQTDERATYVYLSDGGHFDNMGLYELVRRRCRYIIVCDAEEDAGYRFAGMGDALRKCRIDFGAEIEIDLDGMRAAGGRRHMAIGRIRYAATRTDDAAGAGTTDETGEARIGTLVYLKASTHADDRLPADVHSYSRAHPAFPHESTADQWFSESQFESYRKLGEWIATEAFPVRPDSFDDPRRLASHVDALAKSTTAG